MKLFLMLVLALIAVPMLAGCDKSTVVDRSHDASHGFTALERADKRGK